ncbi:hypothetical protein GW889_01385 [Candidatus Berkelbacteria bacterium]|uniref:YoaR-like putative peptidoglycan binding domain-containing protein n=1 Tax=Candidatus Berkelbacteria bacterium CG10_big_fil_rev_8_21_14_0_10_43_14 TaxID=1974515 RepID=A0A2M6R962_9BACT|nr:hypothetical protein [Candidatus Berkelbacteria bacterium]PIS06600.1 MAG: hypothetical protein COT79_03825 [Candidatus Berkelbacteria bacterium CG10_big_fil_rev_8_21_14_0_10_43_14]
MSKKLPKQKAHNKSSDTTHDTTTSQEHIHPLWKRILIRCCFGIGTGIIVFLMLFGIANIVFAHSIYPRVVVGSRSVGQMTPASAQQKIAGDVDAFAKQKLVITTSSGASFSVTPKELGFEPDVQSTIADAYTVGRQTQWLASLYDLAGLFVQANRVPITGAYTQKSVDEYVGALAKQIDIQEKDATLTIDNGTIKPVDGAVGYRIDRIKLQEDIINALTTLTSKALTTTNIAQQPKVFVDGTESAKIKAREMMARTITLTYKEKKYTVDGDQIAQWIVFRAGLDKAPSGSGVNLEAQLNIEKVKAYVVTVAKQIDQDPIDAKLTIEGGKVTVFSQSRDGIKVDQDALSVALQKAIAGETDLAVTIPAKVTSSQVSSDKINELGINELIGEATTSFIRSPENRVHNIQTGSKYLNGQLIKPGAIYSVIESLGAIDGSTGYLPELVIKENKTIPEFGGGLCQVSTTLFRAALNAGLPITERQNHSWRISYYEPPVGLDATIYFPKPDLKIQNDTPGWILIQNSVDVEKSTITFQFYGTKDGRTSKITGPTLLYSIPAPDGEYADDPTLPAGEEKRIQAPHPGGKATATYQVFDKNGKLKNEQTFVSLYKASAAQYLRGTGPAQEAPTEE